MNSGIYIIKFSGHHRVYIGRSVNLKRRFYYHKYTLRKGCHDNLKLQRAYNKYPEGSMSIEALEYVDRCNLDEREKYYINKFDSFKNGFNCTGGGEFSSLVSVNSKTIYAYSAITGDLIGSFLGYAEAERALTINESNIRQCCYGKMKKAKGIHFSLSLKNQQQVLNSIISEYDKPEVIEKFRQNSLGANNAMFGKKRPDICGSKNPYFIKIKNGYKPKRRISISEEEIISLYKSGLTQKQIAGKVNCTQITISDILISNGIRKFLRKEKQDCI